MGKRGRNRKRRSAATRRERREAALAAAAAATSMPQPVATPPVSPPASVKPEPAPIVVDAPAPVVPARRRRERGALVALTGVLGLGAVALLLGVLVARPDTSPQAAAPTSSVFVGTPGGEVIPEATPTPEATPEPTPEPTTAPTRSLAPTPQPTTEPTVAPTATPAPIAIATQPPVAPAPTPEPTPGFVTVALAGPDETVVAFYRHVEAGRFDEAYALWSERMKATYPRQENLDERFDETANITFHQLNVAEQTGSWATVQANFTEVYDSGSSREFIGYWELILTRDGWRLDAPHY